MTNDITPWVVTDEFGEHIWARVNDSPRVTFGRPDTIGLLFKLVKEGHDDLNLVRRTGREYESGNWSHAPALSDPEEDSTFDWELKAGIRDEKADVEASEIRLAMYAYTSNGAMATQEYYQTRGEPAEAIVRIPVPDSMMEKVEESVASLPNCHIIREPGRVFQMRFAETGKFRDAPEHYSHPHIKCEGVGESNALENIFDTAFDLTERGVRRSQ
ncbi:hypothetical protein Harman_41420 [Haloarcula mannanilytica]|uniref:Uncharacterized protein n=1 Tax=Haloarcula mannanilytica TaxID=2509225 RepID=A0A4C2ER34_9EURY|nr:hypothetical protein [Haloarcula mannanilytica]GCF16207.1 hypothetical protein Harman_41420 [Haloarcula mannanilytica]